MGYVGEPVTRREDARLTTGRGRFVHDMTLPGLLHLAVLRSPRAHARIRSIDVRRAASLPGVVGAFGPQDLSEILKEPPTFPPDPRLGGLGEIPLAKDVVRFVGEPLAVVVAESRYAAEDALEAIAVDLEPLPVLVDALAAAESPTLLFPERGSNVLIRLASKVGDGKAALAGADKVVTARLRLARVVAHPIEPRAVLAAYEAASGVLTVWATTQGVHHLRHALSHVLGLPEERIRVVAPDVGGGFGVKNRLYPEDALVAHLAVRLGRPVRWVADRHEEFLATNQAREQIHDAAIGVRSDGTIVAVCDRFVHDNGAYFVEGLVVPSITLGSFPGPYRVPNLEIEGLVVATNKVPNGPYRGAGAPEGAFVMERLMDLAADALGLDRAAFRLKNLIRPEDLPCETGARTFGAPVKVLEGDFPRLMTRALAIAGYDRRRAEAQGRSEQGRLLGVGIANYLEFSGGTGFEGARLHLSESGTVVVATGAGSQGQGHATALAQIAADRLGVRMEDIEVVEADTAAVARGVGTFGSRTTITAGNAVSAGAAALRRKILELAADRLEAPVDDLVMAEGRVHVRGVPSRALSLAELATDPRREDLVVEEYFDPGTSAKGMGTHVAVVEVDPETFAVTLRDYVMVFDGGVLVNPKLVEGQMTGGAVQGIGTALYERLSVDEEGQPRNTSFLDYLLPAAAEMPDFRVEALGFPSPSNPEGFKGIGEGAVIPAAAAIVAAVEDALRPLGLPSILEIPVTPASLFQRMRSAIGSSPRQGADPA